MNSRFLLRFGKKADATGKALVALGNSELPLDISQGELFLSRQLGCPPTTEAIREWFRRTYFREGTEAEIDALARELAKPLRAGLAEDEETDEGELSA